VADQDPTGDGGDLGRRFTRLAQVVAILRERCPWTGALTHQSLLEYLIEEAYEVAEAVETGHTGPDDARELAGELGDVLFQVLLHARLQEESGHFGIADVVESLTAKMIRRNPHVFAPDGSVRATVTADTAEVEQAWDAVKRREKPERTSPFDGIPAGLPALLLAAKTQERARRAGLEVPSPTPEAAAGLTWQGSDELGDHLFDVVAQAQAQGLDAEAALREAVRRFTAGR
jgi:uncharacterized protein YabN with tetrapyrrole methylase and pyrophosphatase domain